MKYCGNTSGREQWTLPGEESWRASWKGGGRHWNVVLQDKVCISNLRILAASVPLLGASPRDSPVHPATLPILFTTHRPEDKAKGLVVVIDARKQPAHPGLVSALQATQALVPAAIRTVLYLGEKEAALQLEALPDTQVRGRQRPQRRRGVVGLS